MLNQVDFFYSNLTLAENPKFYAVVYRDAARPNTWNVDFRRNSGQMVDYEPGFKNDDESGRICQALHNGMGRMA